MSDVVFFCPEVLFFRAAAVGSRKRKDKVHNFFEISILVMSFKHVLSTPHTEVRAEKLWRSLHANLLK